MEDTISQLRSRPDSTGLGRHLDTIYALRALPPGSKVQLEDRDRDAITAALGTDPKTLEAGFDGHAARDTRRGRPPPRADPPRHAALLTARARGRTRARPAVRARAQPASPILATWCRASACRRSRPRRRPARSTCSKSWRGSPSPRRSHLTRTPAISSRLRPSPSPSRERRDGRSGNVRRLAVDPLGVAEPPPSRCWSSRPRRPTPPRPSPASAQPTRPRSTSRSHASSDWEHGLEHVDERVDERNCCRRQRRHGTRRARDPRAVGLGAEPQSWDES